MKITGFEIVPFEVSVDRFGLGEPLPGHKVVQTLARVLTDEGAEGYYLGGHFHGDQDGLLPGEQALITQFVGPLLAGQDPFDREYIWQQLWLSKLPENVVSVVDLALWDLAGRVTGLSVHKLLGGARDKGQGVRQQRQQPGPARGLRHPRGRLPAPRLPRLQDPQRHLLGPRNAAIRPSAALARRRRHRDLPRGAGRRGR